MSVFRLTVLLHKGPSIFYFGLVFFFFLTGTHWFWTGTHDFSQDEFPVGLTITICDKITETNEI